MALAFIGLGSNLGNGQKNLQTAWKKLRCSTGIQPLALSSPYISKPVSKTSHISAPPALENKDRQFQSDRWFTNAVGVLETDLPPEDLLRTLLDVEQAMGRARGKSLDRIIDLDILYYDDLVLESPEVSIPHPEMTDRLFVLAPLEELAPDHRHPVLEKNTMALRRELRLTPDQVVEKKSWEPLPENQ